MLELTKEEIIFLSEILHDYHFQLISKREIDVNHLRLEEITENIKNKIRKSLRSMIDEETKEK